MRNRLHYASAALVLLLVAVLAFRDFVFGPKLLLYKDIGSDSLNYYYPYLLLFSDYIRTEGLPLWSFRVGLGQTLFPDIGVLVFNPAAWFPREWIAHLLVYQHLALILVAGLCFYRFLLLRQLNRSASLLGALLLTLSAYMTMGSCWTVCAGEVVCVAYALFAVELALARGRWIHLPFAVALFPLLTSFHLYLAAVLLTAYALARLAEERSTSFIRLGRHAVLLGGLALLGAALTAIVWGDSLVQIRNSPRGTGMGSYSGELMSLGVFRLETPLHYFTVILRSFANDMTGAGNAYRGWSNYLEASLPYCGLLPLLLLPQVFVRTSTPRRIIAGVFLGAVLLGLALPWFRNLFYLFQGDYYRAFSLYSAAGIIIVSVTVFSRYIERGIINLWLLGGTLAALLGLLYLPVPQMQQLVDGQLQLTAALLLVLYALLLALGRFLRREFIFAIVIIVVTGAELASFNRVTANRDAVVTKEERWQRIGFNDHTIEAVDAIKGDDPTLFYRVTKLYSSSAAEHANLNDSFAFDYYGTTSYTSFNNINYIRFLIGLDAMAPNPTELDTRWCFGLMGRPVLAGFASEKYLLTRDPISPDIAFSYERVGEAGDVQIYRNTAFLPLGLFFEKALPKSVFKQFSAPAKDILPFQWVVLDDAVVAAEFPDQPVPDTDKLLAAMNIRNLPNLIQQRHRTALQLESFRQNRIEGRIDCAADGYLVFQIPFEPGWRVTVDGERVRSVRAKFGLLAVPLAAGDHHVLLRYLPPALWTGGSVSLLAVLLLAFLRWRWPRITALPPRAESA